MDGGFIEDTTDEIDEFGARRKVAAPSAEIDAAEDNLAGAGIAEAAEFLDNAVRRKAAGFAANKGDDAKGATGIAAVLDFQRGARVMAFAAEDGSDKNIGLRKDVAGEDLRGSLSLRERNA